MEHIFFFFCVLLGVENMYRREEQQERGQGEFELLYCFLIAVWSVDNEKRSELGPDPIHDPLETTLEIRKESK